MAIRPGSQETLVFMLELLRRIPRKSKLSARQVSAKELQQQLEGAGLKKDLRTVQRQLKLLSEQFDIECDDRDKPYGYRWKEHAEGFRVPGLSPQDSLLLAWLSNTALDTAGKIDEIDGRVFQTGEIRPHATGQDPPGTGMAIESAYLDTTQPLLPPKIKPGVFEAVSNALYDNKWLKLNYENAQGWRDKYRVMPLGLAQQGPRLYLVCRFEGFDNERSLAVHRIISAEASP